MKTILNSFITGCLLINLIMLMPSCKPNTTEIEHPSQDSVLVSRLQDSAPIAKRFFVTNPIPEEDTLYLPICEVEATLAVMQSEECDEYLLLDGNQVGLQAINVPTVALDSLQRKASSLTVVGGCSNSLTGLKVIFGFQNDKIKLFFTPVRFCRESHSRNPNGECYGSYTLKEGLCYKLQGATFTPVVTSDINSINDYTSHISIKHDENGSHEGFIEDGSILGDTKSMIFSFQEIFAVINENPGTDVLTFWNSIRKVPYNNDTLIKHSLLVSPDDIQTRPHSFIKMRDFTNKFANLSHMCPPSCNSSVHRFAFRLRH